MKLAIIGSRSINFLNLDDYISEKPSVIISGGAIGIDTIAEEWALKNNIRIIIHRPDYITHKKKAAWRRNDIIVDEADKILTLWDGESTGTKYVIDRAIRQKKSIEIIFISSQHNIDIAPKKSDL